jgi:hypothetical protein
MTIYGPNGGVVVGQPISPFFGAQNGASPPGGPIIQQPTTAPTAGGLQATGIQMPLLEAVARGIIPRNAAVASVAGVATSVGITNTNGDALSVDEAMGDGNGAQVNLGVAVPGTSGNPTTVATGGVNNQIFGSGASLPANLAQGPTPTNSETLTSGPVPASTTTANVSLVSNSFLG